MQAVIKVEGVEATFDGERWECPDATLAAFLNAFRWMGSRHSQYGSAGSHAVAVAEEIGAQVVSVEDTPTDNVDIVKGLGESDDESDEE
jgi:hypothetical protein